MFKRILQLLALLMFLFGLSFLFIWQVRDHTYLILFDHFNDNLPVVNKNEVDQILKSFDVLKVNQLDKAYCESSQISDPYYSKMYSGSSFYVISIKDIYRNIAGTVRIRDLLPRDAFYSTAIMNRSNPIYWRIDKNVLYKIIELREELNRRNYRVDGFKVNSGYRTPYYNKEIGGASKSRHLKGEAVDMVILDVDKDGKYTSADKQIVLEILEQQVIRNDGGIGRYPGTKIVHMDTRGYRARWDSY